MLTHYETTIYLPFNCIAHVSYHVQKITQQIVCLFGRLFVCTVNYTKKTTTTKIVSSIFYVVLVLFLLSLDEIRFYALIG